MIALLEVRPRLVGVFIDCDPEEVRQVIQFVGLDLVQLHGSEKPSSSWPLGTMKALKVKDGAVPDAGAWPDPILLDSWSSDQRGGTGQRWETEVARRLISERQVFVAGGLNPENVGRLVRSFRPYGVDVSSGVESAPRIKDPELVRAFVRAVRRAS